MSICSMGRRHEDLPRFGLWFDAAGSSKVIVVDNNTKEVSLKMMALFLTKEQNIFGLKGCRYLAPILRHVLFNPEHVDPVEGPPEGQPSQGLTLWRPPHRVHIKYRFCSFTIAFRTYLVHWCDVPFQFWILYTCIHDCFFDLHAESKMKHA